MNSSLPCVSETQATNFALGKPVMAVTDQRSFRDRLAESNSRRQVYETFVQLLVSAMPIDRAQLLLSGGSDLAKAFTAYKGDSKTVCTQLQTNDGMVSSIGDVEPNSNQTDSEFAALVKLVDLPEDRGISTKCPVVIGSQCIGVVAVYRKSDRPFDKIESDYLKEMSTSMVEVAFIIADETLDLTNASQEHAEQLQELNFVGQQLANSYTEKEVFGIVAAAAKRVLGAARVSYVSTNIDNGTCEVRAMCGNAAIPANKKIPLANSSIEFTMIRNVPCFFDDLQNSRFSEHSKLASQGLTSAISIPIHSSGKIIGVFNAGTESRWQHPEVVQNLFSTLGRFFESSLQRIHAQKSADNMLRQLAHEASHDDLTDLPNRSSFTKTLEQEINPKFRSADPFALLFIDLDDFKKVNDTLSHSVGDQLLVSVGQRMQNAVRPQDEVARLGGDEFVVLLRDVADPSQARLLADRLLESIRAPYQIANNEIVVGGSVGMSLYPSQGTTVSELMVHSDIAMYAAKREGRNNCQIFDEVMATEIQQRMDLHRDLEAALKNQDLHFVYQPQFEVETNQIVACEALVRWEHERRGTVAPNSFVPFAEETGLVTQITEMALEHTLDSILRLRSITPNIYGSINVSAVDFADLPKLMSQIEQALDTRGLPGDALELELTERIFLEYTDAAKIAIETWKQNGIRLAIDDFGTGFSSLKYLLELQIDTLKIDQSFVRNIQSNPRQRGIVETILKMGTSLGAVCIAEGVETADELACLQELGCQIYQGYLGSRPIDFDHMMQTVTSRSV